MLPRRIGGRGLSSDQIQNDGGLPLGGPALDILIGEWDIKMRLLGA
jgi:hypothetical protein